MNTFLPSPSGSKRLDYIDFAKALGMFLIV